MQASLDSGLKKIRNKQFFKDWALPSPATLIKTQWRAG